MRSVIDNKSFTKAEGFEADSALVIDCSFADSDMSGAMIADAVFIRCSFQRVEMYWANMFRTVFLECTFADVGFRNANMDECMFVRCELERCDFSRDQLPGDGEQKVAFVDSPLRDSP